MKGDDMHFVIIGGDAAGMSAASRAKRHGTDLAVTVLEKTRDVSYSA
jgi:flavin-dependent dehydrogenase